MSRLIVVPRWGSHADSDFYPWLRRRAAPYFDEVVMARLLPRSSAPEIVPCVAELHSLLRHSPEQTYVMAHSIGCHAVLRTLATLPWQRVAGCLFVAAWLDVDVDWPALQPWLRAPLDDAAIRPATAQMRVVISDDDPYRPDYENVRDDFEGRFGATVRVEPGRRHFTALREPAVLEELLTLAGLSHARPVRLTPSPMAGGIYGRRR